MCARPSTMGLSLPEAPRSLSVSHAISRTSHAERHPQSSSGSGGVTATLLKSLYGWVNTKRGNFADDFHVYAMEWTNDWMRFYMDNRLQAMINLKISSKNTDSYFYNVGGFPTVAMNVSSGKYIEVQDPWSTAYGGSAAAPFDQRGCIIFLALSIRGRTRLDSVLHGHRPCSRRDEWVVP